MSKTRYHSLDSLRGLAALQVVISHSLVAVPTLAFLVYNNPEEMSNDTIFLLHILQLAFYGAILPQ